MDSILVVVPNDSGSEGVESPRRSPGRLSLEPLVAGVTPFVVAGIEFSKRIAAQKKCDECGGSGLVLIEKENIRCPNFGGFLPWQSWKRFFSG